MKGQIPLRMSLLHVTVKTTAFDLVKVLRAVQFIKFLFRLNRK